MMDDTSSDTEVIVPSKDMPLQRRSPM